GYFTRPYGNLALPAPSVTRRTGRAARALGPHGKDTGEGVGKTIVTRRRIVDAAKDAHLVSVCRVAEVEGAISGVVVGARPADGLVGLNLERRLVDLVRRRIPLIGLVDHAAVDGGFEVDSVTMHVAGGVEQRGIEREGAASRLRVNTGGDVEHEVIQE